MVVYDNAPGSLSNMQVNGVIPSCFITLEDGTKMKTESQKALTVTPDLSDFMDNEEAGQMSVFSSWGPAPDLSLKPEITAPAAISTPLCLTAATATAAAPPWPAPTWRVSLPACCSV